MNPVEGIIARLTDSARATLIDLCDCPGLYAGQYEDLERVPAELVDRRYAGAGEFMGFAKAWPSELGLAVKAALEERI